MLSNAPASSLPISRYTWSSESSPRTSQLSFSPLPYRSIQQPLSQSNNDRIRAASSFDLLDALPAYFLAAFRDNIEEFENKNGDKNI